MKEILALYIRLSLEDRDIDEEKLCSVSVENQRNYLWNYLMANPKLKKGEVREFVDDGHTGTNFDRPALNEMLDLVRERKIKCIVVKDLSRFGRNYFEVGTYLEQIFPYLGVRFIAIDDSYDSNDNGGNVPGLDIAFKNIIYDYYSKELSGKVLQTKRNLARKGLFMGGIPPFGYIRNPNDKHQLIIDTESAKTVRRIFNLTLEGKNKAEIARILNVEQVENPRQRLWRLNIRRAGMTEKEICRTEWTAEAVRGILKNPAVIGSVVNHRVERKALGKSELKLVKKSENIIVPNMHEAIIEKEVFETIQRGYSEQGNERAASAPSKRAYPLSGILKCGYCGRSLKIEGKHNKHYICKYARTSVDEAHTSIKVEEKMMVDTLEEIILIMLKLQRESLISDEENQAAMQVPAVASNRAMSHKTYQKRERLLSDVYEKYVNSKIDKEIFLKQKEKIQEQCGEEVKKGEKLKGQAIEVLPVSFKSIKEQNSEVWLTKELVQSLVKEIRVSQDSGIEILWKCEDWLKS